MNKKQWNAAREKAQALLRRMTPEEKAAQMVQVPVSEVSWEEAQAWARRGAGSFLHVLGERAAQLQKLACETRLGIPVLFGIDAVHGHALNDRATVFPTQLAAACSWDEALVAEMARATAREVAADGLHWTFSPVLCLARDTRWGRVNETFGEDPMLTGALGAAMVRGYQGDDLSAPDSIAACAKHYIGYGEAVGGRDSCDSSLTLRKVRETFLPPFARAVEAGCATVMTAYGFLDGTPLTVHETALKDILRGETGFDGFVVTDWSNVDSLTRVQHVAATVRQACEMAARAGNDMMMNAPEFYEAALAALADGSLEEAVLDEAVLHILTVKFLCGLFEKAAAPAPDTSCMGCDAHLVTAKRAARESVVLLENRGGTLPLGAGVRSIAVAGANADDIRAQYGDWTYFSHPRPDPGHTPRRPYVTVREGVEALASARGIQTVYCPGYSGPQPDEALLEQAVAAAAGCDHIVFVAGDTIELVGEHKDRADLALPPSQRELYRRLRALGKPLTTVLVSSKPLAITEMADTADALLAAFNGGMFGGLAVAEVLFGEVQPTGRLPISFPRHSGQLPVYYNSLPGWHGGKYADLPAAPLYAFGYGLSYTTFACSDLSAVPGEVRVTVRNTGAQDGTVVVQLYFRDCVSSVLTPQKQLLGFQRVSLAAGEARALVFPFSAGDLSLVAPDGRRVAEPGDFLFMAGTSSRDEDLLTTTYTLL